MDLLLLPTAGTTYKIADMLADPVALNTKLGAYTNFVNLMDLAALAVPAGFRADGIPFGVTLIGPAFSDGMLAAIGDALHRVARRRRARRDVVRSVIGPAGAHRRASRRSWSRSPWSVPICRVSRSTGNWSSARPSSSTRRAPPRAIGSTPSPTRRRPSPGCVFDGAGPGAIEVEIWEMDEAAFGSFVALIPAPLGIGTVTLADGRSVKGFLCEAQATRGAEDITAFGGWRAWLARSKGASETP